MNGLNVTNTFQGLAFGQVPFEGIQEQQIKTGGYGAEFGRSTGGVVNIITKRGSNEFTAGGSIHYTPDSLRGTSPDVYTANGERLLADNSKDNTGNDASLAAWASGALIQDRLFAYALVQYDQLEDQQTFGVVSSQTSNQDSSSAPTWLTKSTGTSATIICLS